MHDDCRFDLLARSQFDRPLLVVGELHGIASRLQHAGNSSAQLNLMHHNQNTPSYSEASISADHAMILVHNPNPDGRRHSHLEIDRRLDGGRVSVRFARPRSLLASSYCITTVEFQVVLINSVPAADLTRVLTGARPIKPTSPRCPSAWQPNHGIRSTYSTRKNCSDNRDRLTNQVQGRT